jgi:hexosaminidase
MLFLFRAIGLLLCTVLYFPLSARDRAAIIPEPVSLHWQPDSLAIPSILTYSMPASPRFSALQHTLVGMLQPLRVQARQVSDANAFCQLQFIDAPDTLLGTEGYRLAIGASGIRMEANSPAGLFYALQTLSQLLPVSPPAIGRIYVPSVSITDYPSFRWRGLMLDVSRHFFTKQEVKSHIDLMAKYKFNLFHWHLTDDEGWRLQINALPRLTEVGAWRVEKTGYFGDMIPPKPSEPKTYGGFYTQADVAEIVAYAAERFVNILPEIDVPGHSLAAIVAYPELSCTPDAKNYRVRSGEKIIDWHDNGSFTALVDNALCPANEKVYDFLDKVFAEVAALFPFAYIHIGGDECAHNFWEKLPEIKDLMRREKLNSMDEVQSHFTRRVVDIVRHHGREAIGWDEILEGGIPAGTGVMSWRGTAGGIKAAQQQHPVVMSPTTHCYLDYMKGDVAMEPKVYATLRLKQAYSFNPLPPGVPKTYILGGQANLWTEQVYNLRHAQYMTWPRAFATSEALWSPIAAKNWSHFVQRVESHFARFDAWDIKYAPSMYEPSFSVMRKEDSTLLVSMKADVDDLDIHYSFDNSFPDRHYPKYREPLVVPPDAFMLRTQSYRSGKPVGRVVTVQVADLLKRVSNIK